MRYISLTDTAKLIRVQLKKNFPDTKFSVRSDSYAGGSSIRVNWTNGPTDKAVEAITAPFAGGRFDGMIDLAYSVTSYLHADGSASYGNSKGTGGSHGSDSGYENPQPVDAEEVRFIPNYVFTRRELTPGAKLAVAQEVFARYGEEIPEINEHGEFRLGSQRFHHFFHQVAQEFAL